MDLLLDTSAVSALVDEKHKFHKVVKLICNGTPRPKQWICSITLGELYFGRNILAMRPQGCNASALEGVDRSIYEIKARVDLIPDSSHIGGTYGELVASLARGVAPHRVDGWFKNRHPSTWHSIVDSDGRLKVGLNDLWIAACAVTFNLSLLSCDKDFATVQQHFSRLQLQSLPTSL